MRLPRYVHKCLGLISLLEVATGNTSRFTVPDIISHYQLRIYHLMIYCVLHVDVD